MVISQYYSATSVVPLQDDDAGTAAAVDTVLSRYFYQRANVEPAVTTFVLQSVIVTPLASSLLVTVVYSTQSTT